MTRLITESQTTHILKSPLRLEGVFGNGKNKNKKYALNMNNYRNAVHFTNNKAKIIYKEHMMEQINALPVFDRIVVDYSLFVGTKRVMDTVNVCSVVDKFFMDALVEAGKLTDDNYNYYTKTTMLYGGYSPGVEYVEICINSY